MDDQRTDRSGCGTIVDAIFRVTFGAFGGMFVGYFAVAFATFVFQELFIEDYDATMQFTIGLFGGCPLGLSLA
jgi:hypothetical protein